MLENRHIWRITVNCKNCGRLFDKGRYKNSRLKNVKFCSPQCKETYFLEKSVKNGSKKAYLCSECGNIFVSGDNGNKERYCSRGCYLKNHYSVTKNTEHTCEICGKKFYPKKYRYTSCCSRECGVKHKWSGTSDSPSSGYSRNRRERIKNGTTGPIFTNDDVFLRDNFTCGICGKHIDSSLEHPHPESLSVDHIIPLIKDGIHSLNNVHATHFVCNMRKGTL